MNHWTIFVARRLLGSRRSRGSGAAGLAILGITAGVATLIVVLAVMNGFQLGTIENILELNSFHLRVGTKMTLDTFSEPNPTIAAIRKTEERSSNAFDTVVPFAEIQTLARGYWPEPQGIAIRAVPSDWLNRDQRAQEQVETVAGEFDLTLPNSIVLGAELANALGVRVGDPIALTHIPAGSGRPAEVQLSVVGLFRSGYLDFDRNWGFVSLGVAATVLNAKDPVFYGVKLADRFNVESVTTLLAENLPADRFETWREFNSGIFGALRMEKTMMVLLIGLIFLVVAGNIYQLLRRSILERSQDIAILRALGASQHHLRQVFVLEGWLIGVFGSILGLSIGLVISGNLNGIFRGLEWITGLAGTGGVRVFSPAYFYIQEIPRRIFPIEVFTVTAGAIGVSATAARFAASSVVRVRPMELLRNE